MGPSGKLCFIFLFGGLLNFLFIGTGIQNLVTSSRSITFEFFVLNNFQHLAI